MIIKGYIELLKCAQSVDEIKAIGVDINLYLDTVDERVRSEHREALYGEYQQNIKAIKNGAERPTFEELIPVEARRPAQRADANFTRYGGRIRVRIPQWLAQKKGCREDMIGNEIHRTEKAILFRLDDANVDWEGWLPISLTTIEVLQQEPVGEPERQHRGRMQDFSVNMEVDASQFMEAFNRIGADARAGYNAESIRQAAESIGNRHRPRMQMISTPTLASGGFIGLDSSDHASDALQYQLGAMSGAQAMRTHIEGEWVRGNGYRPQNDIERSIQQKMPADNNGLEFRLDLEMGRDHRSNRRTFRDKYRLNICGCVIKGDISSHNERPSQRILLAELVRHIARRYSLTRGEIAYTVEKMLETGSGWCALLSQDEIAEEN